MAKGVGRVVAVLAVRNEERFIGGAIEHLVQQGVDVYLIDNGSDDATVDIALDRGGDRLVGLERVHFDGVYRWEELLRRKEHVFRRLDADWVMHLDPDERPLPCPGFETLVQAFAAVDAAGYDRVEFEEFTYVPTAEEPDHDHPDFASTLTSYYFFRPRPLHLVRAYKLGRHPIEIAWSGGHRPKDAPGSVVAPLAFPLRHYLFLSPAHAVRKYGLRRFDPAELARGRHTWRNRIGGEGPLPPAALLRRDTGSGEFDRSDPWQRHWLDIASGQ